MTVKIQVGENVHTLTNDHKENGKFVQYENVLQAFSQCSFSSKENLDYWNARLKDANSPSSRIAVCRQMVHENSSQRP